MATRCNTCNSVITQSDSECYICNEPVPGARKPFWRRNRAPKVPAPVTPLSNLLFVSSLVLSIVCLLSHRVPPSMTAGLAGFLFAARMYTDRRAAKRLRAERLPLRPVSIARLHY